MKAVSWLWKASIRRPVSSLSRIVWRPFTFVMAVALGTVMLQMCHFLPPRTLVQKTVHYEYLRHRRSILFQGALSDTSSECMKTIISDAMPLLTLFTSMKDHPEREKIHNNTIYNWISLAPQVLSVLYVEKNGSHLARYAKDAGWLIRPVPATKMGIPVLSTLFVDAINTYDTPYYAFANADILFDQSLVKTLEALYKMNVTNENYKWRGSSNSIGPNMSYTQMGKRNPTGGLLVIGRRTNVNLTDLTDLDDISQLKDVASKRGHVFVTNAEDYFITTAEGIPWQHVPNFVIGRPGYDNWIVARALDWKLTTVDASDSILAVHQTGIDGNMAGWTAKDETLCLNRHLAGKYFDYRPGHTKCCLWKTQKDISSQIRIFKRDTISKDCTRRAKPKQNKGRCM